MSHERAKEIMATVLSMHGAADRLTPLIEEWRTARALEDVTREEGVRRAIEDIAGHRHDGRWVSVATIIEAYDLTRWYASMQDRAPKKWREVDCPHCGHQMLTRGEGVLRCSECGLVGGRS